MQSLCIAGGSTRRSLGYWRRFASNGTVLDGNIVKNDDYLANKRQMDSYTSDFHAAVKQIHLGGGDKTVTKHKSRGKLLARERINLLVDSGSPFLELSTLAAYDMYGGGVPGAGIVTGIGRVNNIECMIVANDATVKGDHSLTHSLTYSHSLTIKVVHTIL